MYFIPMDCHLRNEIKLTEKHVGSTLRFHFQPVSHLSVSNCCNTDQTAHGQVQNHKIEFITIILASMPLASFLGCFSSDPFYTCR